MKKRIVWTILASGQPWNHADTKKKAQEWIDNFYKKNYPEHVWTLEERRISKRPK